MGTRIGPMYSQFEREAKRLRRNGADAEANKLDAQASQMRLNRTSNIAKNGENQAERVGYAAGQAGLVESQRRSQSEQLRLDREAQAQSTRLVAAQAGALEAQNRGGTDTKPSVAPNAALASTPRPSATGGATNGGSPFYNPDSGVSATQSPASARPSLAAQPREGLIDGKPASETLGTRRGVNDAPGNLADLRKRDEGSRQEAISAALKGAAGDTSATRSSVIDSINKKRKKEGLTPFGDDIYKDIAKADAEPTRMEASERKYDIDQRTLALGQANEKKLAEASKDAEEKLGRLTPAEIRNLAQQHTDKLLGKTGDPVLARERARDREADGYMTAAEKLADQKRRKDTKP